MAENPYEAPGIQAEVVVDDAATSLSFDRTLWEIRKEAGNAVLCGVIAFLFGLIFAPIAIICGRRALRLIEQHGKGHEYEARARLGMRLGYIGIGILVFAFVLAASALVIPLLIRMEV